MKEEVECMDEKKRFLRKTPLICMNFRSVDMSPSLKLSPRLYISLLINWL